MDNRMNCLICKKEIYSSLEKGCKLCGMPLEEEDDEFCCNSCNLKYHIINGI